MLTESEAKTKWCPLVRVVFPAGHAANKPSPALQKIIENSATESEKAYFALEISSCNCIASACMLWCWHGGQPGTEERPGFCGVAGPYSWADK